MDKNQIIKYQGKQITLFSNGKEDYVNLTEMAHAWRGRRKAIKSWLKNKQTLAFLEVWENKHNPDFNGTQMGAVREIAKDPSKSLSLIQYIELTKAIGIFTRAGKHAGTYAHKDIAIRFGGWLSPEFELHLIEEIQRLKEIERKKYSYELLTHDQILNLVRLKEVFKYVAHQEVIESAHKDVFVAKSGSENPFRLFNNWRNKVLEIQPKIINSRIEEYCKINNIPNKINKYKKLAKREKILILDSHESVRNAVWDFLNIKGEVNALNLANLVRDMMKIENGEVLRANETDLFHTKEKLWGYEDFEDRINNMSEVKSARQVLELRGQRRKKELAESNDNSDKKLNN